MKKKIFVIAMAVCLVAIMAFGSLAYFTNSSSVNNKFMVATTSSTGSESPEDKLFSVEISETDKNGQKTTSGNEYTDMVPGSVFDKKPVVKNTGAVAQYVRVIVTIDNATNWLAADDSFTAANLFDKLVPATIPGTTTTNFDASLWDRVDPTAVVGDKLTYTFYYKGGANNGKLLKDDTVTLFSKVQIPTSLKTDDMVLLSTFNMGIQADAIQAENTGASAKEAFTNCWGN